MPGFELIGEEEKKEINDVLEKKILFRYGFEKKQICLSKASVFENELSDFLGCKYCYLCASGTAALHIALAACGVGVGDEVLVPPFTFIATIEAILSVGAVPIFSEIDETLCLNPSKIEENITSRTKAVIAVHMCGAMAKIEQITEICKKNKLILIEDVCQSLGGSFHGKALGTFGDIGCFSFDGVKTVTCGEGGAIITDKSALYEITHSFADHGHDHLAESRGQDGNPILGNNYRISELNAAVGVAQIRKLEFILNRQRKIKTIIKREMENIKNIDFRLIPDHDGDSCTFISFFMNSEDDTRRAIKKLTEFGVDGCFYWFGNNWHYMRNWNQLKMVKTPYKMPFVLSKNVPDYSKIAMPESDKIMSRTISIAIKLSWAASEIDRRIDAIKMALSSI